MKQAIDYTALQGEIRAAEVMKRLLRSGWTWLIVASASFLILVLATISSAGGQGLPLAVIIGIVFFAGLLLLTVYSAERQRIVQEKLAVFAAQNGMRLSVNHGETNLPGMIFTQGHSKRVREALTTSDGVTIGNYQYTTGSGKNQQTHKFGFVWIPLKRKLPHMVLDATKNNFFGFSNLPTTFTRDQTLSLEGDFNSYFTLYAPKQYERDALYVFTPDVMQTLVERCSDYDVEIVDNHMFLYRRGTLALHEPAILDGLFGVIGHIRPDMSKQVIRYADERVGDRQADVVTAQGVRLKRGFPWLVALLVGGFFVSQLVPQRILTVGPDIPVIPFAIVFGGILVGVIIIYSRQRQ